MRKANLGVAIFLFLIGAITMYDSVRLGFRWDPGFGPGAGYLPFYLSLGMLICTGIFIVKQVIQLSKVGIVGDKPLIQEGGLKPILWVLIPSTVMVILVSIIGLHLAAADLSRFLHAGGGEDRLARVRSGEHPHALLACTSCSTGCS